MKSSFKTSLEMDYDIPGIVNGVPGFASFEARGESFYLIECTGELKMKTDVSPFKTYRKQCGEKFDEGDEFTRIEVRNYGPATTIKLWTGWGEYIDRRYELMEAPTTLKGWDAVAQEIPEMGYVDFVPQHGDGLIRRKSIIITNLDPNENLRITDTDDHTFMTVFPRTSITLPPSNTVRINNDTGAAISCNVGEIYYIESNLLTVAS